MSTRRPNPTLMPLADLEEAIETEMAKNPDGSPYADLLHDEFDRRDGASVDVDDTCVDEP